MANQEIIGSVPAKKYNSESHKEAGKECKALRA